MSIWIIFAIFSLYVLWCFSMGFMCVAGWNDGRKGLKIPSLSSWFYLSALLYALTILGTWHLSKHVNEIATSEEQGALR